MQTTTDHQSPQTNSTPQRIAPPWEEIYLEILLETGQKAKAAMVARVSLLQVVRHRHLDAEFVNLELEVFEAFFDRMESEAIRRAVEGVEVSRPGRNGEVTTRVVYSDSLLFKLLQRYVWNTKVPPKPAGPNRGYPTPAELARVRAEIAAAHKRFLQRPDENEFQPKTATAR